MKFTELRIGNLLQDAISKAVLVVCKIEIGIVTTIVRDREKYPLANGWYQEPIPLTEEWLLKFGFEKNFDIPFVDYEWQLGKFSLSENLEPHLGLFTGENQFKSVHQLQNLYFALTGEELQIK